MFPAVPFLTLHPLRTTRLTEINYLLIYLYDRHIIWSNQNLDVDDWREDYKEFLEANELDDDPNDEQALYEWMEETNYDYLSDERVNLNVQLSQPIIVIGDIGRWNGRVMGYKDIPSGNIRDCLYADTDYTEWYGRRP